MARELGLNPKKLGSIANHRQEPWKRPLPEFIEDLYSKRFGRDVPEQTLSIEAIAKQQAHNKAEKRARKKKTAVTPPSDSGSRQGTSSSADITPTTILTDAQVRMLSDQMRAVLADSFPGIDWSKHDSERIVRMMALSARCKEAREERGLSIKEVADQLRIPQYRIKAIEAGTSAKLHPAHLQSYVDFLNLKRWLRQWGEANPELAKGLGIDDI